VRVLLVGYGKMGQLVAQLAPQYGCEVAGVVDPYSKEHGGGPDDGAWTNVDVAIDFSTPDSVMTNAPVLARRKINLVIGTTGWSGELDRLRRIAEDAGIGVVAAPNFSTGVVLFEAIVARAARLFSKQEEFDAFVHESHHAAKRDAPSGTALQLKAAIEGAGYTRRLDISSTRAGHIPGTHVVGFDGPAETVTLTHSARDRSAFARGALAAAHWVKGKRGWFSMQDVLGVGG
jgi:4-hydroxy-tetrahydrodipicolinate reductase